MCDWGVFVGLILTLGPFLYFLLFSGELLLGPVSLSQV